MSVTITTVNESGFAVAFARGTALLLNYDSTGDSASLAGAKDFFKQAWVAADGNDESGMAYHMMTAVRSIESRSVTHAAA